MALEMVGFDDRQNDLPHVPGDYTAKPVLQLTPFPAEQS